MVHIPIIPLVIFQSTLYNSYMKATAHWQGANHAISGYLGIHL